MDVGRTPSGPTSASAAAGPQRRILVINGKGGCGKTTLSTNLAACLAARGEGVAIFDYDPQGSSSQWLALRDARRPPIHGVNAHRRPGVGQTRSFQLRVPEDTRYIIMDAPAGVQGPDLIELLREADTVVMPVLPSPFDIRAASHFIRDLLLVGRVRARAVRVAVVANRVRSKNQNYRMLQRFLNSLEIPFLTRLRDSENYLRAAEAGIGIHELERRDAERDRAHWVPLLKWIAQEAPTVSQPPASLTPRRSHG